MNIFQEINRHKDLTETEKTVASLRALADAVESVKDFFPELSWHGLFNNAHPWNNLLMPYVRIENTCLIPYRDIKVDLVNVWRAEKVMVNNERAVACVVVPGTNYTVEVMRIENLLTQDIFREVLLEVVGMLPPEMRYQVYKPIAQNKRRERRERLQRIADLQVELSRLVTTRVG